MKNDLYNYNQYIFQNEEYFKFSIDSILLAEFVEIKNNFEILDLCSGNCPIPLILTTKNSTIHIDAVELQPEIYDLGIKSININKKNNQITLYKCDAKLYEANKKYNIVTCNPPYFKVNSKISNNNLIKSIARHEIKINLEDIFEIANKHIIDNGDFYLVNRSERFLDIIEYAKKYHWGIRKVCFVYTNENKDAEIVLIKMSKCKKDDCKIFYKNVNNISDYKNIFKEV